MLKATRELQQKFRLPRIWNYYGGANYGTHAMAVQIGGIELYYSYQIIVAYYEPQDGLVVIKNYWSTTTGKHLNAINEDKSKRLDMEAFQAKLMAMLERRLGGGDETTTADPG